MELKDYPIQFSWIDGAEIPVNGKLIRFKLTVEEHRDSTLIQLKDNQIILITPNLSKDIIKSSVAFWFKKACKGIIVSKANFYADLMEVNYNRIVMKEQKTCWGSCSSKNNLNFNWKLLLMPPDIMNYVIIHELAHLIELNHSKAFWAIVEAFMPEYKIYRKWLKENGMFYMTL